MVNNKTQLDELMSSLVASKNSVPTPSRDTKNLQL